MAMSCEMHDRLESSAVKKQVCLIEYVDEHGGEYSVTATPLDCWVEIGVEWGRFRTVAGEEVMLNLSDIVLVKPVV